MKLKPNLSKEFCDDPLFDFFYGKNLEPERYLLSNEEMEKVKQAREVIREYLLSLSQILES